MASEEETEAPPRPERCNVLLLSLLSVWVIGFGVWLVLDVDRYREEYAQAVEGWRVGGTRVVELTLVAADREGLACASDQLMADLRCEHQSDLGRVGGSPSEDPNVLQPYNTVKSELLLGAGLWTSPDLRGDLPPGRFTVVCNYHIQGVVKSASTRFGRHAAFAPLRHSVTAGVLTDCLLPR